MFHSLHGKPSQKAIKTALAVCSMLIAFLSSDVHHTYVLYGFRLGP